MCVSVGLVEHGEIAEEVANNQGSVTTAGPKSQWTNSGVLKTSRLNSASL